MTDPAHTPDPCSTPEQAIAIATRALANARPGCAITLTPRVLRLLLDAAAPSTPGDTP
jgi:hypothetical protein